MGALSHKPFPSICDSVGILSESGMYLSGYSHLDLNGSDWHLGLSGVWISLDPNGSWISVAFGCQGILPLGSPWVSAAFVYQWHLGFWDH